MPRSRCGRPHRADLGVQRAPGPCQLTCGAQALGTGRPQVHQFQTGVEVPTTRLPSPPPGRALHRAAQGPKRRRFWAYPGTTPWPFEDTERPVPETGSLPAQSPRRGHIRAGSREPHGRLLRHAGGVPAQRFPSFPTKRARPSTVTAAESDQYIAPRKPRHLTYPAWHVPPPYVSHQILIHSCHHSKERKGHDKELSIAQSTLRPTFNTAAGADPKARTRRSALHDRVLE